MKVLRWVIVADPCRERDLLEAIEGGGLFRTRLEAQMDRDEHMDPAARLRVAAVQIVLDPEGA